MHLFATMSTSEMKFSPSVSSVFLRKFSSHFYNAKANESCCVFCFIPFYIIQRLTLDK